MYDIEKITITDFRSFKGEHEFVFPVGPGLYGIEGKNLTMRGDESNGAGKSSLLEAIHWCDYGATSRGLKAGDIVRRGATGCAVVVHHVIGSDKFVVKRTQSPNSLTLNDNPVDQEALEKALRIGPGAFKYAVLTPQFGDSFFDKTPTEKLAVFSEIMGLDYWLVKSKEASELANEIAAEKQRLEQKLAGAQGSLTTIKADLVGLKSNRDNFEIERKQRLKDLAKQTDATADQLIIEEPKLKKLEIEINQKEKELKKYKDHVVTIGAQSQTDSQTIDTLVEGKAILETKLRGVVKTISSIDNLKGTCPTCRQVVDGIHLKNEKRILEREAADLGKRLETAVKGLNASISIYDKAIENMSLTNAVIASINRDLQRLGDDHRAVDRKVTSLNGTFDAINKNFNDETHKQNPYIGMLDGKLEAEQKLVQVIKQHEAAIDSSAEDHASVNYWVNGFKRIRLYLIEDAIKQLELEINNNLGSLGLMDWLITLDVERENKSGGVTKGFTVLVQPPDSDKPVRLETYSGGETQRLRLAGNLGLANLIMERAGLRNTIEFFDEPSQHLSAEGLLDLTETLYQRAIDSQKRIFTIEHKLLDYPYTDTFTVIKDKNGSRIDHTG